MHNQLMKFEQGEKNQKEERKEKEKGKKGGKKCFASWLLRGFVWIFDRRKYQITKIHQRHAVLYY